MGEGSYEGCKEVGKARKGGGNEGSYEGRTFAPQHWRGLLRNAPVSRVPRRGRKRVRVVMFFH
eukprot:4196074-Prorocentrum_lima.AAC.1